MIDEGNNGPRLVIATVLDYAKMILKVFKGHNISSMALAAVSEITVQSILWQNAVWCCQ